MSSIERSPLFDNWLRLHLPLPHLPSQEALALVRRIEIDKLTAYLDLRLTTSDLAARVSTVFSNKRTNILHLCCMIGNHPALQFLLNLKDRVATIDVNSLDTLRWSPFHFAAVTNDRPSMNVLGSNGAERLLKNHRGATPLDFIEITSMDSTRGRQFFYADTTDTEPIEISEEILCDRINAPRFCNHMVVDPAFLVQDWVEEIAVPARKPKTDIAYARLKSHPVKLYLRPNLVIEGHEVVVGENIEENRFICEYSGLYDPKSVVRSTSGYALEGVIDSKHCRSVGAMINDGWPNCWLFLSHNLNGLQKAFIFYPLRKIKQGEVLLWDYGINDNVKWGKYHLHNLDRILADCRTIFSDQNAIKSFPEEINKLKQGVVSLQCHQLVYVAQTPHLMILLISQKILSFSGLQSLMNSLPAEISYGLPDRKMEFLFYLLAKIDFLSLSITQSDQNQISDIVTQNSVRDIYINLNKLLKLKLPKWSA